MPERTTKTVASLAGARQTELLDFGQAARKLGCSDRLVRKLVDRRDLASVKVGALVRIEPQAIDDYIASRRRPAVVVATGKG